MAANKFRPGSLFRRVYLPKVVTKVRHHPGKTLLKLLEKEKIALIARTRPLSAILSVSVLSSRAIAFRNLTPAPWGCTDCM